MDAPLRSLTPEEIRRYDEDGVVMARGVFPDSWLERMAAAVDRVVESPTPMGNAVSMKDQGFSGDLFLWKTNNDFRDWVYESPAALVARQLLRTRRVHHFYDQLFVKPAGCHVPTPWHHDITFWPVRVECTSLVSIWISFDDVDRASSGLEFVKGSQRWPARYKAVTPNYDPYMLDSDFDDAPDIDGQRDAYDLFCPDMQVGDCLLFGPHVVHGSSSNTSTEKPRRAFSTRWAGEGVVYEPRHATVPLFWEHGLAPGDELGGPLFPQVLPEPIAAEGARRWAAPELPSPELVKQFVAKVAAVAPRDQKAQS